MKEVKISHRRRQLFCNNIFDSDSNLWSSRLARTGSPGSEEDDALAWVSEEEGRDDPWRRNWKSGLEGLLRSRRRRRRHHLQKVPGGRFPFGHPPQLSVSPSRR